MKKAYFKNILGVIILSIMSIGFVNYTKAANYFTMSGNVYECTMGNGYDTVEQTCYSYCFVQNTQITMADGTLKDIEDVQVGDWLKGSIGPNKVEYLIRKSDNEYIYGFNGGKKFVTDSHPFMTTKGWKSINPEATKKGGYPGVDVSKLEIGDILITENGSLEIKSIESEYAPQKVYTFGVNGTNDYYADGYLVHNKYQAIAGVCGPGFINTSGHPVYDWAYQILPGPYLEARCDYDRGPAILVAPVYTGGGLGVDKDILNMFYWDKSGDNTYNSGIDRPLIIPSYTVSHSGFNTYPYTLFFPYYDTTLSIRVNNGANITMGGMYTYGVSQGSAAWINYMNQGFTTTDPLSATAYIGTGVGNIQGIEIGLDYACGGTGTQTLSFIEYSCPSGYNQGGNGCFTGSTVVGGPCMSNNDCTSPGFCNGYSYTPPNTEFKFNDAGPWNASHPNWNQRPHGNAGGYCRDGDEAIGCIPNNPNQSPNWYGGGILCGCGNFIPNNDSVTVYGSCTTSSYQHIPAIQTTATEIVQCSGGTGCLLQTQSPVLCDINDPLMAGVCYIPGGFGTTLLVTDSMVGINTLTPAYPLDVEGVIRAAHILTLSDARLKLSIEKIDGALEKIRAINGYTFTWKDSGEPDLGVLAQEIEKVFADAVVTDKNGKKTVQYNALLAPIIEAIKELHTQIDALYNEKFDSQVKRIEAIEKAVK